MGGVVVGDQQQQREVFAHFGGVGLGHCLHNVEIEVPQVGPGGVGLGLPLTLAV